ncbi:MAG: hypothetical protein QXU69_03430 [Thermofilaceae archaeon]
MPGRILMDIEAEEQGAREKVPQQTVVSAVPSAPPPAAQPPLQPLAPPAAAAPTPAPPPPQVPPSFSAPRPAAAPLSAQPPQPVSTAVGAQPPRQLPKMIEEVELHKPSPSELAGELKAGSTAVEKVLEMAERAGYTVLQRGWYVQGRLHREVLIGDPWTGEYAHALLGPGGAEVKVGRVEREPGTIVQWELPKFACRPEAVARLVVNPGLAKAAEAEFERLAERLGVEKTGSQHVRQFEVAARLLERAGVPWEMGVYEWVYKVSHLPTHEFVRALEEARVDLGGRWVPLTELAGYDPSRAVKLAAERLGLPEGAGRYEVALELARRAGLPELEAAQAAGRLAAMSEAQFARWLEEGAVKLQAGSAAVEVPVKDLFDIKDAGKLAASVLEEQQFYEKRMQLLEAAGRMGPLDWFTAGLLSQVKLSPSWTARALEWAAGGSKAASVLEWRPYRGYAPAAMPRDPLSRAAVAAGAVAGGVVGAVAPLAEYAAASIAVGKAVEAGAKLHELAEAKVEGAKTFREFLAWRTVEKLTRPAAWIAERSTVYYGEKPEEVVVKGRPVEREGMRLTELSVKERMAKVPITEREYEQFLKATKGMERVGYLGEGVLEQAGVKMRGAGELLQTGKGVQIGFAPSMEQLKAGEGFRLALQRFRERLFTPGIEEAFKMTLREPRVLWAKAPTAPPPAQPKMGPPPPSPQPPPPQPALPQPKLESVLKSIPLEEPVEPYFDLGGTRLSAALQLGGEVFSGKAFAAVGKAVSVPQLWVPPPPRIEAPLGAQPPVTAAPTGAPQITLRLPEVKAAPAAVVKPLEAPELKPARREEKVHTPLLAPTAVETRERSAERQERRETLIEPPISLPELRMEQYARVEKGARVDLPVLAGAGARMDLPAEGVFKGAWRGAGLGLYAGVGSSVRPAAMLASAPDTVSTALKAAAEQTAHWGRGGGAAAAYRARGLGWEHWTVDWFRAFSGTVFREVFGGGRRRGRGRGWW